jgi:hypothetical protein
VRLLNTVDLPTFGNPTMPTFIPLLYQVVARRYGEGREKNPTRPSRENVRAARCVFGGVGGEDRFGR